MFTWNRKFATALKLTTMVVMISLAPSISSFVSPMPSFSKASRALAASGDSIYSRYFPGDAQNIVIPDLKKNLDALLQYDRTACGDLIHKEVDLINQYGVNAALSQRSEAKKVSHQIHELLNAAKIAPNQPCLDIAFKAYAVGSIFLLDPKNYNSPKVTIGSGFVTNDFAAMKGATEVSALSNFPLTYLTAALANKGKLQFFLEPVELPSSKGEQVNANSNSGDAREILGAYDCSSSTLHLDPWLPPLDLGATLLHELDHLFLDKKFTKDELNAEFANADGSIDWRAYVLDDEFAAITHSAIAQRAMYVVPRGFWHFTLPGSPYSFQWSTMPYQLDADLRLFSKEGPIASLELMFEPGVSTTSLLAAAAARNLQLTSRFLNEQFAPFTNDDVLSQFDKASAKIVEIVNEPYFQGLPLTPAEKDTLKADRHGMELIPLPIWMRDHDVSATPLLGTTEPKEGDLVFVGPTNSFSSDKKQITRTDISGMDNLIKGIDEVVLSMDQPSDVCKLYMDAVGQGQLGDYIGTEVQLEGSEAVSAQPGAAGARPGAAGARPGAAGARPGAAGARPGAAGARPSAGNIRPCLSQMHDL